MGGNLLKKWALPDKRLPNNLYHELGERLSSAVAEYAPDRKFRPLRHFAAKQDHGDFDGLLETKSGDSYNWIEFLGKLAGFKPHKNGATISVPIDGFQCDFNLAPSSSYECSYNYHSWETGMLLGVTARRSGLQYASAGLFLMLPLSYFDDNLPDHEFKNILITTDTEVIFNILGFDYERFAKGFDSREDMYEWVAQSRYFIGNYFEYTELNHQNKTRNAKRPTYAAFLEWAKSRRDKEQAPSKDAMRAKIIAEFPHVSVEMDKHHAQLLKDAERRAKFNGNLIAELKNIAGAELGRFIVAFKKSVGVDFEAWLDVNSAESVKTALEKFSLTES